MVFVA